MLEVLNHAIDVREARLKQLDEINKRVVQEYNEVSIALGALKKVREEVIDAEVSEQKIDDNTTDTNIHDGVSVD